MVRISQGLGDAIGRLDCSSFQIGALRDYPVADLRDGQLAHLGVIADDVGVRGPDAGSVLPSAERGRYSAWNHHGREVPRTDLPKVPRSFVRWVYPYGDTSRTQVPAYSTRLVYRTQRLHGNADRVVVDVNAPSTSGLARVGFRVDRVFDRAVALDDPELVMAARLLHENVAAAGAVCSDLSSAEWTAYRDVGWELLPKGLRGPGLALEIARRLGEAAFGPAADVAAERLDAVMALQPADVLLAAGKFDAYVAYVFRRDLVVLENLAYGNALYVMHENWEALSRRSRLELLADPRADYVRIVHAAGWAEQLRVAVQRSRRRS